MDESNALSNPQEIRSTLYVSAPADIKFHWINHTIQQIVIAVIDTETRHTIKLKKQIK